VRSDCHAGTTWGIKGQTRWCAARARSEVAQATLTGRQYQAGERSVVRCRDFSDEPRQLVRLMNRQRSRMYIYHTVWYFSDEMWAEVDGALAWRKR
jgi:hypothetical protein